MEKPCADSCSYWAVTSLFDAKHTPDWRIPQQPIFNCRVAVVLSGKASWTVNETIYEANDTVSEIGQAVGFHDPFHFSRSFREFSGASPSEFAERHRRALQHPFSPS